MAGDLIVGKVDEHADADHYGGGDDTTVFHHTIGQRRIRGVDRVEGLAMRIFGDGKDQFEHVREGTEHREQQRPDRHPVGSRGGFAVMSFFKMLGGFQRFQNLLHIRGLCPLEDFASKLLARHAAAKFAIKTGQALGDKLADGRIFHVSGQRQARRDDLAVELFANQCVPCLGRLGPTLGGEIFLELRRAFTIVTGVNFLRLGVILLEGIEGILAVLLVPIAIHQFSQQPGPVVGEAIFVKARTENRKQRKEGFAFRAVERVGILFGALEGVNPFLNCAPHQGQRSRLLALDAKLLGE